MTGASGFIGSALAVHLAVTGRRVRGIYHRGGPEARMRGLVDAGVNLERHDLTTEKGACVALRGCSTVVHCAAAVGDWGVQSKFQRQNVEMSRIVTSAAAVAGCHRFVHASSAAVHGFGPHVCSTEDGPFYAPVSHYQKSKLAAERIVRRISPDSVILRLGNVYGPDDTTSFYRILQAIDRGLPAFIDGGRHLTCPVYIEDVVHAFELSLQVEAAEGKIFLITGGEEVRWRELLFYAAQQLDCNPPRRSLPAWLALPAARLVEQIYNRLSLVSEPPLTVYRVAQVAHDYHFSINQARMLLGFVPSVGFQQGVDRTVRSYREIHRKGACCSR